ncbi:hypothetical protein [Gloeothece verrucosa]|uniref:hypothetical protein n=1 Tax=Gloeothece verrucosa TaxID=2546359 RepID=UPI00017E2086|nr:hypothetical protein [Gloeothece verrucosa]
MNERKTSDDDPIELRIAAFKQSLDDSSQTEQLIVQKFITHGTPYIFRDNEDSYFDLKYEIAQHFSLESPEMVRMVGSAKLGFSIAPKKLWRKFSEESDIDMVIISRSVFEEY